MEKKPFFHGPRPVNRGPNPMRRGPQDRNSKEQHAINERIRAREVRLVGENVEQGIYSIHEALKMA